MMTNHWGKASTFLALSAACIGWQVRPAHAEQGIAACGDIQLEAQAECEVVPPGAECKAMCEPLAVRAQCDIRIAGECRASCDELPTVDCNADCSASCSADCDKLDPGHFDCAAACGADCEGRCSADCEASDDRASCEASCDGSCKASCDASCEGTPPMIDCEAGCEASCEGSCEVDANIDCQAECQGDARADCEAELQGGCDVACESHDGALFCDGQYVDYGDNLKTCVDALKAAIHAHVMGEAEAQSSCSGNSCSGSAKAKVSSDCAVSIPAPGRSGSWPATIFAVLALSRLRRPRRNV
jgi:hypothetical protein